tara:strand:+ start:395 stop:1084 length:690 start_codon:yes stop_codon:yes gene_type:complete
MWIQSTLLKIKKETDQTWRFFIKSNEDFDFVAGQFVRIKINDIVRSYSIASFNSSNNIFELLIVRLDGGKMTNLLFNKIKEGDKLEIKGPLGRFTLPENIDGDMLFICTGTGLAPFRSILQSIQLTGINHYKIYLIFGTRTSNDLLCFDEMIDFQRKIDGFKFIPVLSREKWSGKSGYVHDQYLELIKSDVLKNPIFYLCGWRDMIKEARMNLKELGFDSKKIKLEIYG